MGWKYATEEERLAAVRELNRARYLREKQEMAPPAPIERPSRMPAELAKRERLRREIQQIRWVA